MSQRVSRIAAALLAAITVCVFGMGETSLAEAQARRGGGGRAAARPVNTRTSVNRNVHANQNVNVNRNVNVDVDRDYYGRGGYYGGGYHPVATAAAVAVTAAAIGSIVYSLPPSCQTVMVNGLAYQQCGGSWYQPQYSGSQVTYVVVNSPR